MICSSFKLGEPFEEITGDGRKVKPKYVPGWLRLLHQINLLTLSQVLSTMSMVEPNKMMHQMLGTDGGKDSVCTREFLREKMVNVCQV